MTIAYRLGLRRAPGASFYALALLVVLPAFLAMVVKDKFYMHVLIMMLLYATASSAWNIVAGFAGQLSLGHAAFFGIGAYTSSLLFVNLGVSPWIGMLAGGLLSAAVGAGIGYPSFRLRGPFFSLVTIAFAEVLRIMAVTFQNVTKGAMGVSVPFRPRPENFMFRETSDYVYVAQALLVAVILVGLWIERSRLGYYLVALRENEDAAQALGINTTRYKLAATVLSAFFTSLAGTFYAQYILYIEPFGMFSMDLSMLLAMMSIIGGMGTVWGPVAGAFLVSPLQEVLRAKLGGGLQGLDLVVYGTMLIAVVILLPSGIIPTLGRWFRQVLGRRRVGAPAVKGEKKWS